MLTFLKDLYFEFKELSCNKKRTPTKKRSQYD